VSEHPIGDGPGMRRTDVLRASPPLFESRLLDTFSRVHPLVPVLIFVPAIVGLAAWELSFRGLPPTLGLMVLGYALWTLFEYWLHRLVFHFEPDHGVGARLHWIIHGIHHEHPNDPLRLVMPPAVSIPLGGLVFGAIYLAFGKTYAPGVGAGCCASGTCATTSKTTRAGSGSARPTGTRCSAPPLARTSPSPPSTSSRKERCSRRPLEVHAAPRGVGALDSPYSAGLGPPPTAHRQNERKTPWPPATSTGS
jgi:dihydroceramide fatty acyl 2-hydroxylase